jgi:Carboxypeptidase regulatory-like domain
MSRLVGCLATAWMCVAISMPASVTAQQRASIVGVAHDSTGAALPGVTVDASSPALIERSRSVVTDDAGRFAIIDLRPGTYTVTFTLAGFRAVRREGIVLEGSFAAQVNAELSLGAITETVTVTGASPVVDVQSTQNQAVLNRTVLDALPAARTMQGGASLVPGVSYYQQGFVSTMSVHGSQTLDQHIFQDGMKIGQNLTGSGSQTNGTAVNDLGQTELVFDAGSQSAEYALGGVRMDAIPKEGGNTFSGTYRLYGSTGRFQNDNITRELQPFIRAGDTLDFTYDSNLVLGGPIRRDRLWYFGSMRVSQTNVFVANTFFKDGRQADRGGMVLPNATARLTYQMSPRNKLVFAYYNSWGGGGGTKRYDVGGGATSGNVVAITEPEASYELFGPLNYSSQLKWQSPVTSRLLLEVHQSLAVATYKFRYQQGPPAGPVGPLDVQHLEATTSRRTVATQTNNTYFNQIWNTVANIAYVTGSHAFKAGVNQAWGYSTTGYENHGDMSVLTFINGRPSSVGVRNTPTRVHPNLNADLGLFAQDKWTVGRLTLTGGGRWDYFNASSAADSVGGGRFVPAREAPDVSCLPCWSDWAIRAGASYDMLGNGKTALKVSVGKFVASQALGLATSVDPLALQTETRSWTDLDGNGSALDAAGDAQYAEIGPKRNANFGLPIGQTKVDPNTPRPNNWEESVSIQQEVMSGVSVTAGYYRRQFYNLGVTKNLLVDPVLDWTPFTITAPTDPRLPNGGGEVLTLYNLNPAKLGAVDNVSSFSTGNTRVYNGFEASVNARLPHGGFAFSGITVERTATNNCADLTNSDPNNLRFCDQAPPFRPLFKASAGYTLPYDVQVSGTFQSRSGIPIAATYTYDSAIAGVALTGGGNRNVNLVDPTTQFYDYVKTNDLRVARTFRFGSKRLVAFVEIFNLANLSTIFTVNETYGSLYLNPQQVVQGRRFQFGGQAEF